MASASRVLNFRTPDLSVHKILDVRSASEADEFGRIALLALRGGMPAVFVFLMDSKSEKSAFGCRCCDFREIFRQFKIFQFQADPDIKCDIIYVTIGSTGVD